MKGWSQRSSEQVELAASSAWGQMCKLNTLVSLHDQLIKTAPHCIPPSQNCCKTPALIRSPEWHAHISNGKNTPSVPFIILELKPCPTTDSYIEISKSILRISAPSLTRTFLCCIRWKIWLWSEMTACRKSTCIRAENNIPVWSREEVLQCECAATSLCSHFLALFHCCFFFWL